MRATLSRLRPLLDGEPIVMIQDGKVLDRNLKRERLTEEELAMEARLQHLPEPVVLKNFCSDAVTSPYEARCKP